MHNQNSAGRLFWILFMAGFCARLAGLFFNGVYDIDQFLFQWGSAVKAAGLAKAFQENYGPLSYLLYGFWAVLADHMPRFWWAPYKAMEIAFEAGIFVALWQLTPVSKRFIIFPFYWLNPWFVIHGAWHGFWEGPHTLFGLLAVCSLKFVKEENWAWFLAGAMLAASAFFKPQGLFYFLIPLGIYLVLEGAMSRRIRLFWYAAGAAVVWAPFLFYFAAGGRGWLAILKNYLSVVRVMPNLCNECINVWRPVTRLLMHLLGQEGPTTALEFPKIFLMLVHMAVFLSVMLLIGFFCLHLFKSRKSLGKHNPPLVALMIMAFSALAIPQLATKAHMNHAYAGLVFFIPLVAVYRPMRWAWTGMILIHLYAHLADQGIGRASVYVPLRLRDYPYGTRLIEQLRPYVHIPPDGLLKFQSTANQLFAHLPREPLVSILSAVQFFLAVYLLRTLFDKARSFEEVS